MNNNNGSELFGCMDGELQLGCCYLASTRCDIARIFSRESSISVSFSFRGEKTKKPPPPQLSVVYRSSFRSYEARGRNGDRNTSTLTRASSDAPNESNKDAIEKIVGNERNGDVCARSKISIIASTMRCIIEDRGFMYRR